MINYHEKHILFESKKNICNNKTKVLKEWCLLLKIRLLDISKQFRHSGLNCLEMSKSLKNIKNYDVDEQSILLI